MSQNDTLADSVISPNQWGYAAHMQAQSEGARKGVRTKVAIMCVTCGFLQTHPASDLTVARLCKAAGIAHGTFYVHFADLHALMADLLLGFVEFAQDVMKQAARQGQGDTVRATTAAYYDLFAANTGVMKCLVNRSEDFPEALQAFQQLNRDWVMGVVEAAQRRAPGSGMAEEERIRRTYALGGMVDQYLTAVLLNNDPTLSAVSQDRDVVIETLTTLWKKGLEE